MSLYRPISVSPNPIPISRAATDRALKSHVKDRSIADRAQLPAVPVSAASHSSTRATSAAPAVPKAAVSQAILPHSPTRAAVQAEQQQQAQPQPQSQPHMVYAQKAGKVIDTSVEDRMRQIDIRV